jgi:phage major head subunit gpT-like protein
MLTPALLQSFFVQSDMRYQNAYKEVVTYWDRFAELAPSGTETMIFNWLAQFPKMRKWVGEKVMNNLKARAYPLTSDDWENTYWVDRNKIADDQAGIFSRAPELQARVAARWPEDLVTTALINGTTALGYDGAAFFSANHPVDIDDPSLGTYSNLNTTSALTANTYAAAKAQMRSYKGEGGVSLQVMPTLLMVGPSNEQTAKQIILGSNITQIVQQAGVNVAAAAPSNVWVGDTTLIVNERLIDDTAGAWYLMSTDMLKPFVFVQREAVHRIPLVDPTNPLVFNQKKFAFSIEGRGTAGYSLPFLAIKNVP